MSFRKNYTDDDIKKAVKENVSIAGVLRELELKIAGGNYTTINRKIKELNLDTSHFTGKLWSKEKFLKNYDEYISKEGLKKRLKNDFGNKCQNCGRKTWLGKPITLEVHHIDGNSLNNRIENLMLLCPNCHSYTKNWRGRNSKIKKSYK